MSYIVTTRIVSRSKICIVALLTKTNVSYPKQPKRETRIETQ
jgi:hypothetical protein